MAYDAFISYSHAVDGGFAAALQSSLHAFARPWYKLRALHTFRDQTNLAVNPDLWSSIRDALDQSRFFVLFASPEAAASPWVAKEAEHWIGKNGTSRVLIVLTGGTLKWDRVAGSFTPESTNALPASLMHAFAEEPLFLDCRWARDGVTRFRMREPRFHEAVLQLAATLHNRPKDELDGADVRMRRHARWLAASGLITILLIALFARHQTRIVDVVSVRNLAADLATKSAKVLADNPDRAREAALLAIESIRLSPSFEGNQALRAALALLPANAHVYPPDDANPSKRVRDMAFSHDGATLVVVRDDGSTQLMDVVNHKSIGFVTPDDQPAAQVELPRDPQSASSDDDAAVSVAFNASDSMLATGTRSGMTHVWAMPGGREVLRISHGAPVAQLAFHPKTNQLVTASDDGHVRIFDADRAALVADFTCPGKAVFVAFSSSGELLAASSSEGVISLFDPVRRKLLRTLVGGEAAFNLAFSSSGKRLASASGDFAFVWDATSGQQLLKATHAATAETLTPGQWIYSAAITPDGTLLAYAARGDSVAHVWNVETGRQILELKHDSAVAVVAFNADGTQLGTGSYDGTSRVWELPSGRELARGPVGGGAEVVVFSSSSGRFAAGGMEGSVVVSETRRADRPASFDLPAESRSVAFSPDGRRLAIATTSARHLSLVRIADTDGKVLRDIEFPGAPLIDKLLFPDPNHVIAKWSSKLFLITIDKSSATVLPDVSGDMRFDASGKMFAVQRDGVSRLYALPGLQPTSSVDGTPPDLLGAGDEGRLLAFGTNKPPNEFFVDIWSVASKARLCHIPMPSESNRGAFNPSGTVLFTAQGENLQAWDIPSGKQRFVLKASGDIDQIVPGPSSEAVATVTHGRLTVWDAVTGIHLAQLPDAGYLRSAAFSPDGRFLLTGYDEHAAALWLWRSVDLRDQACARLTGNLSQDEWRRWLPNQPYRQTCTNLPSAH